jgi:hypothetical protein
MRLIKERNLDANLSKPGVMKEGINYKKKLPAKTGSYE